MFPRRRPLVQPLPQHRPLRPVEPGRGPHRLTQGRGEARVEGLAARRRQLVQPVEEPLAADVVTPGADDGAAGRRRSPRGASTLRVMRSARRAVSRKYSPLGCRRGGLAVADGAGRGLRLPGIRDFLSSGQPALPFRGYYRRGRLRLSGRRRPRERVTAWLALLPDSPAPLDEALQQRTFGVLFPEGVVPEPLRRPTAHVVWRPHGLQDVIGDAKELPPTSG